MKTVHLICAARPNFMKIAPLYHALKKTDWCEPIVIWIRQHTDANMTKDFFSELGVPQPLCFENYAAALMFQQNRPDAVVIPGDVWASREAALDAVDARLPVVHLEAGLRSWDRTMPEEINRIVIDAVSDLLWTTEPDADENLAHHPQRVERVGNIMIDTLEMMMPKIDAVPKRIFPYAVVTLHRPSNVDYPDRLNELFDQVNKIHQYMSVVFPVHPRTQRQLSNIGRGSYSLCAPLPYVEFMALVKNATIVITDSGGVQEETSYLGVPCATVRENTERPITLTYGTNALISPRDIVPSARLALAGKWKTGMPIPLWDGHTAERCVASLKDFLGVA